MISTILLTCDYSPCGKPFHRAVWQVSPANFCSPTCYRAERKSRQAQISFADRFWSKVDKTPGYGPQGVCWLWTGATHANGYGNFRATPYKEGNISAHIVSWFLKTGEWPEEGLFVLHSCDVKACVNNEACLFLGTHADNMQDMSAKGRGWSMTHPELALRGDSHPARLHPERMARGLANGAYTHPERRPRGESNGKSKLTDAQCDELCALYASGQWTIRQLSTRYAMTYQAVRYRIRTYRPDLMDK